MDNKNKKILVGLICIVIIIFLFSTFAFIYCRYYEKGIGNNGNAMSINDNNSFSNLNINSNNKNEGQCRIVTENLDKSLVFQENEIPVIGYADFNATTIDKTMHIKLYKIKDSKQYIKFVTKGVSSTSELTLIDTIETKIIKNSEEGRAAYFNYGKTYEKGYYLAEYNLEGECNNYYQPIQISNMSTYVGNTERDLIIWVMDATTDKPKQNTFVNLSNHKYTIDDDGLIKIVNLFNDEEDKIFFIKIESDDDELLVAVKNFNNENYYTSFIYTDKPIYKTTDTINVWGFIPLDLFIDKINKENFKIEFNNKKYDIKLNDDGIFKLEIDYKDVEANVFESVKLYYNKKEIAVAPIEIIDYVKPKIEYTILTNQNNYYVTDTIKAEVIVNLLTGEPIKNKKVYLSFEGKKYTCTTNEMGKCTVNIKDYKMDESNIFFDDEQYVLKSRIYLSDNNNEINGYSGDNVLASASVNIVNIDTKLIAKLEMVDKDKYYIDLTTQKISIVNDKLVYTNTTSNVDVEVSEEIDKRLNKKYTKYNPYTKKYDDYYLYVDDCDLLCETNVIKKDSITLENGYKKITNLNYLSTLQKEKDYTVTKNYSIKFKTNDTNGKKIEKELKIPWLTIDNYYIVKNFNSSYAKNTFPPFCNPTVDWYDGGCLWYPILRYKNVKELYSIDEKIDTRLYENDITEKKDGTKLTYVYKEKVLDTYFNEDELMYKDKYFPSAYIDGSYYEPSNNYMYLSEKNYMDYRNKDRYVNIEMSMNKSIYKPNDNVTLKIKVTDINNKGIKIDTLISVVDEAIFLGEEDRASEIVTIYKDKFFPFYQYSTHTELPFIPNGGPDGGIVGPGNGPYRDTIYFENIKTDENGEATITFKLNDLETKFRITAISVNKNLYYGSNVIKIISKK